MNVDPVLLRKELMYLIIYLVISIPVLVLYLWLSKKARKEWMVLMGQLKPKVAYEWERREYIRLGTVFPVEFQKIDGEKLGPLRQGFTGDISRNGMCIEARVLHGRRLENIIPDQTKLKLIINMPIYAKPVEARGTIRWIQKSEEGNIDKYVMGISYDDIREEDASRIIKYALWLYRRPVFVGSVVVLLILIIAMLFTFLSNLRAGRLQLQREVGVTSQEKRILVDRIKKAELEKTGLNRELQNLLETETRLREELPAIKEKEIIDKEEIVEKRRSLELELELEKVLGEKEALRERLDQLEEETRPEAASVEEPIYPSEAELEIPEEPSAYKIFRDYILKEDIQLLDRYCYQHKSSIYHAAGLFALAELRYKHSHEMHWLTVENTYKEVIKNYPRSKYASYASHRIDQIKRRRSYDTYTLRYFYIVYSLPPLFDYREIEPYYKE